MSVECGAEFVKRLDNGGREGGKEAGKEGGRKEGRKDLVYIVLEEQGDMVTIIFRGRTREEKHTRGTTWELGRAQNKAWASCGSSDWVHSLVLVPEALTPYPEFVLHSAQNLGLWSPFSHVLSFLVSTVSHPPQPRSSSSHLVSDYITLPQGRRTLEDDLDEFKTVIRVCVLAGVL